MMSFLRKARYEIRKGTTVSAIDPSPVKMFGIKARYRHRLDNRFFDATGSEEGWQREVYEAAAFEARAIGAQSVFDVGCGSGYKLIKNFFKYRTVGIELEATVTFLKKKYPDRDWRTAGFDERIEEPADIVICADVIEHVPNPDRLMDFLARMKFRKLFLSTPDRYLVYGFDQSGPPDNPAHCREWTMNELNNYVAQWLVVERHIISNAKQATQLVVGLAKS